MGKRNRPYISSAGDAAGTDGKERRGLPPEAPGRNEAWTDIDFHADEFNRIDGLNDFAGDCLCFDTLEGITTADMRHRAEARKQRGAFHCPPADSGQALPISKLDGPQSKIPPSPDEAGSISVISHGRTLIIDTDPRRAERCETVLTAGQLPCTVLIMTGSKSPGSRPGPRRFREALRVFVSGAFSCFYAAITVRGENKEPDLWAAPFDLVLDMRDSHSFMGRRPPPGYFATGQDAGRIESALAEMPEMRGRFKKPHLAVLADDRCLHARPRSLACSACLKVCDYGALKSGGGKITIDHRLCQGCGACALVCRADALRMVRPSHDEVLGGLRELLLESRTGPGRPRVVVLTDADISNAEAIVYRFDSIALAGLDVVLAALAYGAGRVVVACGRDNTLPIKNAVQRQVETARAILAGLSLPGECVRFLEIEKGTLELEREIRDAAGQDVIAPEASGPSAFSHGPGRRTTIRKAARHLREQAGADNDYLELPAGSPFGSIFIDKGACTLCKSCISSCPTGALSGAGAGFELAFSEDDCHQCGLCREVCPENAIELLPRLACGTAEPGTARVLNRAEPLNCLECGKPFASERMVGRIEAKLRGHWMYSGEGQARRLRMCPLCRTRDVLASREGMPWKRI